MSCQMGYVLVVRPDDPAAAPPVDLCFLGSTCRFRDGTGEAVDSACPY